MKLGAGVSWVPDASISLWRQRQQILPKPRVYQITRRHRPKYRDLWNLPFHMCVVAYIKLYGAVHVCQALLTCISLNVQLSHEYKSNKQIIGTGPPYTFGKLFPLSLVCDADASINMFLPQLSVSEWEWIAQMYGSRKRIGCYSHAKKRFSVSVWGASHWIQARSEWYMYIICLFFF